MEREEKKTDRAKWEHDGGKVRGVGEGERWWGKAKGQR